MMTTIYGLLALALLAAPLQVSTQKRKISGKVHLQRSRVLQHVDTGPINITVTNELNDSVVVGEQRVTSSDHWWFDKAPQWGRVAVQFEKRCYEPTTRPNVQVGDRDMELPPVTLNVWGPCPYVAAKRANKDAWERHGGVWRVYRIEKEKKKNTAIVDAPAPITEPDFDGAQAPELLEVVPPSVEVVMERIKAAARAARRSKLFDIFQYNFAAALEAYADIDPLSEALLRFKRDPANEDLFKEIGSVTPAHYHDVIRAEFVTGDPVNVEHVKQVVKEEAVSAEIRGSASNAQLNVAPGDQEMVAYYRQQNRLDSSAPFFETSTYALYRLNAGDDREKIERDILKRDDPRRVLISMQATAVAESIEGNRTPPDGVREVAVVATNTQLPAELRAAAARTLRTFAHRGSGDAVNTLITIAEKDASEDVRREAVEALGAGRLESIQKVKDFLALTAARDASPEVRTAATASLASGPAAPRLTFTTYAYATANK